MKGRFALAALLLVMTLVFLVPAVVFAATPAAPTKFTATSGDGTMELRWDANLANADGGYEYTYSATETFPATPTWTSAGTNISDETFTIASGTLTVGQTYYFKLRGVGSGTDEEGPATDAVSELQSELPDAPTLGVPSRGDKEVTLTWTAGSNNLVTESSYRYTTDGGASWADIEDSVDTTTYTVTKLSSEDTELTNGTEYTFAVLASNDVGESASSNERTATPAGAPLAPTLEDPSRGDAEVTLTWTAAYYNGDDITGYQYRQSADDGNNWSPDWPAEPTNLSAGGVNATTYKVTGLTNGTEYTFAVRAVNMEGVGVSSETKTATPAGAPLAPGNLMASVSPGTVTLTWTAAYYNGDDITGYQYRQSADDGNNWSPDWPAEPTNLSAGGVNATTYEVTGLTNGTEYTFAVRAVNGVGEGVSDTVNAKPLAPPAAPGNLTSSVASVTVTLSWTAATTPTAVTKYEYRQKKDDGDFGDWMDTDSASSHTVMGLDNGSDYVFQVRAVHDNATPDDSEDDVPGAEAEVAANKRAASTVDEKLEVKIIAPLDAGDITIELDSDECSNSVSGESDSLCVVVEASASDAFSRGASLEISLAPSRWDDIKDPFMEGELRLYKRSNSQEAWNPVEQCSAGSTTECYTLIESVGGSETTIEVQNIPSFSQYALKTNVAPESTDNIRHRVFVQGDAPLELDLADYFTDSDNDLLKYVAESSNTRAVTVAVTEEGILVLTPRALGTATITVTAEDKDSETETQTFRVKVELRNVAPFAVGRIPDQVIVMDGSSHTLDVSGYFRDLDNDFLRYAPQSVDPMVLTATVMGNTVVFNPGGLGTTSMVVTAFDKADATAYQTFMITVVEPEVPNVAPEAVGAIEDQTVQVGDEPLELDVADYFTDADGDELTYMAASSDEAIATVTAMGSTISLTGVAAGEATITVTATDPSGESAMQMFMVTVSLPNTAPEAVGFIEDQVMLENGVPMEIDVAEYFTDADGDELEYTAESANAEVVTSVLIDGVTVMVLSPFAPGEGVEVTVTATDPVGESATQSFMVTVLEAMMPVEPPTATPEPTPEPTIAPTVEPTVAPTVEPTVAPTVAPEVDDGGGFPAWAIVLILLIVVGVGAGVFVMQRNRS